MESVRPHLVIIEFSSVHAAIIINDRASANLHSVFLRRPRHKFDFRCGEDSDSVEEARFPCFTSKNNQSKIQFSPMSYPLGTLCHLSMSVITRTIAISLLLFYYSSSSSITDQLSTSI